MALNLKVQDLNTNEGIVQADIMVLKLGQGGLIPKTEAYSTDENGELDILFTKEELKQNDISIHASKKSYFTSENSVLYINNDTDFSKEYRLFLSTEKEEHKETLELEIPKYGTAAFLNYLKQGEKIGRYMPKFSLTDIDSLLETGAEDDVIEVFQLGKAITDRKERYFYAIAKLWIIESTRHNMDEPTSGGMIFPNLYFQEGSDTIKINPRNGDFDFFENQLNLAFDHYRNWWSNKSGYETDSLFKVDPLKETDFYWK